MGKSSAKGGFRLFIGVAASNVIMAVGTMILAALLSPTEYGIYAVALTPSMMFNLFRDWGLNSAITKYVAHFKASENEQDMRDIIASGLIFEIFVGLVLCLLSVLTSDFVATNLLQRPEVASFISIISVTIFSGSLLTTAQSSFVGLERMEFSSVTIVTQAVVKSVASPLLVILGFGVMGPVLGHTLSFLLSAAVGLALLYFVVLRNLKAGGINRTGIRKSLKTMLNYGVPLSISTMLEGFLGQFYGFMMAIYISDNIIIGNFKVATNFAVLLTFFSFPISTVLFPAFSKIDSLNDKRLLKTVFTSSVKYSTLLLIPATTAMMVLSKPMINTLYGEKWVYAPLFLSVYVVSYILQGIGNMSIGGLLRGLGETKTLLKLDIVTQLIGVALAFWLIPSVGIMGVIAGPILASIPSIFLGFHWIRKKYEVTADWASSAKILLASTIAAAAVYFGLNFFNKFAFLGLTVGGAIFLSIFVILAPTIGALTRSDIHSLRAMLSGLGIISRIVDPPLDAFEKLANRTRFSKKE